MTNNIGIGTLKIKVALITGKRRTFRKVFKVTNTPLWMGLSDWTLWFKNYDETLTSLALSLFSEFGFKLAHAGSNRSGYYAKFVARPQSFRSCMRLVRRLVNKGALGTRLTEKELAEKCVLSRLTG
jgi:hypothetical protein